jgi:hypothetical protein
MVLAFVYMLLQNLSISFGYKHDKLDKTLSMPNVN